ncbi:MAG: hypothetical protein ACK4N5_21875, partial [Myxococcales bacterium]
RIALDTGLTTTVAGTGDKGGFPIAAGGDPLGVALRSPWDLAWDAARRRLYVAMAGSHQLFAYVPDEGTLEVLAGTGVEARLDGPFEACAFAQPSGLTLLDGRLYVADSEISAVREVDLDARAVRTLAGGDLFDFGDDDGPGHRARFQHPMGIAAGAGVLFVADSYNHKVKQVDPGSGEVRTRFGNGDPHFARLLPVQPDPARPVLVDATAPAFFEPEGLAVHGGVLYVADTNSHRVLAVDLSSGLARQVAGDAG